jgi:TM2 domain-containing membrane protein YozV
MKKITFPNCFAALFPEAETCPRCGKGAHPLSFAEKTQTTTGTSIPQSTFENPPHMIRSFKDFLPSIAGRVKIPSIFPKTSSGPGKPSGPARQGQTSPHNFIVIVVLCVLLGVFGVHRFVVGKKASAVAMLILTFTLVGSVITFIWMIADLVFLASGKFTDAQGRVVRKGLLP